MSIPGNTRQYPSTHVDARVVKTSRTGRTGIRPAPPRFSLHRRQLTLNAVSSMTNEV